VGNCKQNSIGVGSASGDPEKLARGGAMCVGSEAIYINCRWPSRVAIAFLLNANQWRHVSQFAREHKRWWLLTGVAFPFGSDLPFWSWIVLVRNEVSDTKALSQKSEVCFMDSVQHTSHCFFRWSSTPDVFLSRLERHAALKISKLELTIQYVWPCALSG